MMFLIRMAFWLMILVLLLPTDEKQQTDVYGTAQAAVKDVSGFCGRNPGVCEKGKDAFAVFVHKAEFGAQMLMGFITERTGASATSGTVAPAATPEPAPRPAPASASWEQVPTVTTPSASLVQSSQNTLNPDDLLPTWGQPRHTGT
jgi:hypothetical protein